MRGWLERVTLAVAAVAIVGLVVLNVMAATGQFEDEQEPPVAAPATDGEETTTREPAGAEEPEEPATTTAPETETETETATETAPATTEAEPEPPPPPRLVLTATRGECYLVVRRGSADGELLYEAILPQGGAVDFTGARLWLRLGASTNVDATLDGRPVELPAGTVDVLVTRAGAELA